MIGYIVVSDDGQYYAASAGQKSETKGTTKIEEASIFPNRSMASAAKKNFGRFGGPAGRQATVKKIKLEPVQ